MANKEALRELQTRLATRLQAAREQPRDAGWLAVECGSAGLLLPLGQAGEIQAVKDLTPVPHSAAWLAGVANVRGQLDAVIDLAVFLRLRAAAAPRPGAQLVVLNTSLRVNAALMIDRLAGLRDTSQLTRMPDDGLPRPAYAKQAWRDERGRRWDELDLARLVSDPLFLDLAA
ncbi:MAG: chemotaxis protein CheW [Burkholderiales bacterium PBB6]|jgi:twitching motility protein PilI|uniref:CheW domain-containing protein n=1 Tax=Ideonella margarita TaxID=2984191 RepID=A0ABU9C114_9BURK|nr:MAG: chemotaxis protein CheW [Burkholderiales bacterium PBB6]